MHHHEVGGAGRGRDDDHRRGDVLESGGPGDGAGRHERGRLPRRRVRAAPDGPHVIPVAPAAGVTEVRVESITGDAVSLTITLAGTGFSVGCQGDDRCETSLVGSAPPVVVSTAHPGAEVSVNDLLLTIPAAADGTAIVALTRA